MTDEPKRDMAATISFSLPIVTLNRLSAYMAAKDLDRSKAIQRALDEMLDRADEEAAA